MVTRKAIGVMLATVRKGAAIKKTLVFVIKIAIIWKIRVIQMVNKMNVVIRMVNQKTLVILTANWNTMVKKEITKLK